MKTINMFRDRVRRLIGHVPYLSTFVFMDADAIYAHLKQEGAVQYISGLRPSERRLLHFSLGTDIRNAYLLWHPNNPFTMLKLDGLSNEQQANSPYHPDNYSWEIIRRLIVAAGINQTSEDFDAAEALTYSLMARYDDDDSTLEDIRKAVRDLIAHERWDLLEDVYDESILLGASNAKLHALLWATVGYSTKISPASYLRVATRCTAAGDEVPTE